MKKDIYKEVPENFHRQFQKTLAGLEEGINDMVLSWQPPFLPVRP